VSVFKLFDAGAQDAWGAKGMAVGTHLSTKVMPSVVWSTSQTRNDIEVLSSEGMMLKGGGGGGDGKSFGGCGRSACM
jgi:hypothetical protein